MPLLAINHHYFRKERTHGGIYPSTPTSLGCELSKLRKKKWKIAHQDDVLKFIKGEISQDEKLALLTFDDGFREHLEALEYLEKNGAHGICFVPTAPLITGRLLNVHKLQMIRSKVADEEIISRIRQSFNFDKLTRGVSSPRTQYRYDDLKARQLKYFVNFSKGRIQKSRWLSNYFVHLFGQEEKAAKKLYLSRGELKQLGKNNQLGSHCHSHTPLRTLSSKEMFFELSASKRVLNRITGVRPLGVSYPYGSKVAVNTKAFRIAKKCGYEYGLTMERGTNQSRFTALGLYRIDCKDLDNFL